MTMPVLFYLVGAAIVPIAFHFISRRDSRLLARDELDHAIETLPRIQRQLRELLELHQAQRARWRKPQLTPCVTTAQSCSGSFSSGSSLLNCQTGQKMSTTAAIPLIPFYGNCAPLLTPYL
jgi:hypothetical protein